MSSLTVARKDFDDAIRSKVLLSLSALFVLFAVGAAYIFAELVNPQAASNVTTVGLISFLLGPAGTLVPLTGLVVGYKAIVGERESGSLKFLLALPHTRLDVVVGKVLGRATVVATAVLVGFALAGVLVLTLYSSFSAAVYLGFTLLTIIFGLVFVAIAVGISASTASSTKATAAVIAFFVVFEFLWSIVPSLLLYVVNGFSFPQGVPGSWFFFLQNATPSAAYSNAVQTILASQTQVPPNVPPNVSSAFYLEDWFGFVILFVWAVVPLAIGYWRFENADL